MAHRIKIDVTVSKSFRDTFRATYTFRPGKPMLALTADPQDFPTTGVFNYHAINA